MRTARKLADHLRRRRETLGLTLQEVSRQSAKLHEPLPVSTLSRIERGVLDPGVRRLHVLLRIYRIDPVIAADLAELEQLAPDSPSGDIRTLRAEAEKFWGEGDAAQTLSRIFAILLFTRTQPEHRTERQKALLFSAIVSRGLGKKQLAKRIVDELLCQPLEGPLLVDVLVLAAALWLASGSLEVSHALIARAAELVDPADRRRVAIVGHQRAKLEKERGNYERAEELLVEALEGYRAAGDTHNEALARVLRVAVIEGLGRIDEAIATARETVDFAEAKDHGLIKISAYLQLGRVLLVAARPQEALEELRRALASAVILGSGGHEHTAHSLLAQAFEAIGDKVRAAAEAERAAALWRWAEEKKEEDGETRPLM